MTGELREAGITLGSPIDDAVWPFYAVMGADAKDALDLCLTREAYMARYGRVPPSELRRLSSEHANALFSKIAETVTNEYKARAAANPFSPPTEEDAG